MNWLADAVHRPLEAVAEARRWLAEDPLFLDTETTGLSVVAEVVEICITASNGAPLLDTLVRPKRPIPYSATEIHGISDADVRDAPAWPEVQSRVRDICAGRLVVVYNAEFDTRILRQTSRIHGLSLFELEARCLMELFAAWRGQWDDYHGCWRWARLADAAMAFGCEIEGAHRARSDCLAAAAVLRGMANLAVDSGS